jgi:hypothetical protein
MSDKLALWAAKLNELEIGWFVLDGDAIVYDGRMTVIRSDGVCYSVFCWDNNWGWSAEPPPLAFVFYLPDGAGGSVNSPADLGGKPLETWLLTTAVATALGWKLLDKHYRLHLSLDHGVLIGRDSIASSPYQWGLCIPFFSLDTDPATYEVELSILLPCGAKGGSWREHLITLPPKSVVSLGCKGIDSIVTLVLL